MAADAAGLGIGDIAGATEVRVLGHVCIGVECTEEDVNLAGEPGSTECALGTFGLTG